MDSDGSTAVTSRCSGSYDPAPAPTLMTLAAAPRPRCTNSAIRGSARGLPNSRNRWPHSRSPRRASRNEAGRRRTFDLANRVGGAFGILSGATLVAQGVRVHDIGSFAGRRSLGQGRPWHRRCAMIGETDARHRRPPGAGSSGVAGHHSPPGLYVEVLDAWRTSCPRLPVWEEANERGYIDRQHSPDSGSSVSVSAVGAAHLAAHRQPPPSRS